MNKLEEIRRAARLSNFFPNSIRATVIHTVKDGYHLKRLEVKEVCGKKEVYARYTKDYCKDELVQVFELQVIQTWVVSNYNIPSDQIVDKTDQQIAEYPNLPQLDGDID